MASTAFQTVINRHPAPGVAGDKVDLNPTVYTSGNPLADGPVTVGTFVWATEKGAANTVATATAPLGIVERVQCYYSYDMLAGATLTIGEGSPLSVIFKGDVYVTTLTAATRGQKVFAVLADGTIKTGDAGSTVADAMETDWYVVSSGAANSLIIISNWEPRAAAIQNSKRG